MRLLCPPSEARDFFIQIADHILEFNNYFKDKDFDDRYYPQFEWFRGELNCTDKILNLGCGNGRETFALMWAMKAKETTGVDIDCAKIVHAMECAQDIQKFSEIVRQALANIHSDQLQTWRDSIPTEILECIVPQFFQGDVSDNLLESISRPDGYFDLVYCRNVLYFIADESNAKLYLALQNIVRSVKPETGRVVVIEPTVRVSIRYDFRNYFEQAGLILVKEPPESKDHLGYLEMPETKPMGYILKR